MAEALKFEKKERKVSCATLDGISASDYYNDAVDDDNDDYELRLETKQGIRK